ncbi:hypothetical protein BD408DRAFT_426100 [Parasitella parasitica]|nr:hypothetical protein BD408DRAFT_426100 [Parasitella parasitica]
MYASLILCQIYWRHFFNRSRLSNISRDRFGFAFSLVHFLCSVFVVTIESLF